MLPFTREIIVLEDGDRAEVTIDSIRIENDGKEVTRPIETISWDPITAQKGGYEHYMLKEIHEQPQVVGETFRGRLNIDNATIHFDDLNIDDELVKSLERVVFTACGTAWHACLVTKFLIESLVGIPCDIDYASEFRYRTPVLNKKNLFGVISQSGETADTLAALELAKDYCETFAICNVLGSSVAVSYTHLTLPTICSV